SRRRHTRWPRDWSSDVCSSDLFGKGTLVSLTNPVPTNAATPAAPASAAPRSIAIPSSTDVGTIQTPSTPESSSTGLPAVNYGARSEEHTSELQSRGHLVCRLLL